MCVCVPYVLDYPLSSHHGSGSKTKKSAQKKNPETSKNRQTKTKHPVPQTKDHGNKGKKSSPSVETRKSSHSPDVLTSVIPPVTVQSMKRKRSPPSKPSNTGTSNTNKKKKKNLVSSFLTDMVQALIKSELEKHLDYQS